MSVTRAVTRIRNVLLFEFPSADVVIEPNVNVTSSPSAAPPPMLGAGTVPLKS